MATWKPLMASQCDALAPRLAALLTTGLEQERADTALGKFGGPGGSDLWDLPPIDSKSVAKLSPFIKDLVGRRLDPRWIRKGGYASVAEAVDHILAQLRSHCVLGGASVTAGKAVAVALSP